ncbi:MIP/aquaporin family protein [Parvularcula sp. LCG005]|uniref:MIP/aquaporin family protein n=1 Tax=Parvularcula sp. LCG005 TaxID=3078805 RepID=UPI0029439798|nr:MIP/aquaporin family protein [Parvularcula sp. LCG005]WOI53207.1 MIP/aquaporin family protein [Parvularcula sp. LCG005]
MPYAKKWVAECLGTALLLAIVIGSGIMGDVLSTDDAVALLGNTLATGAGLVVLIWMFGPISGAHFNPAVTLSFLLQRQIGPAAATGFILAQIIGAFLGVWLAHGMFDLEIMQVSIKAREGIGQVLGESVATFALVLTILLTVRQRPEAVAVAVGLVIVAGYWFTSSTSFANPAVTLARSLSDTFAGIAPSSIPGFLLGQGIGMLAATGIAGWLVPAARPQTA